MPSGTSRCGSGSPAIFYFVTLADAQAFVDRFACRVWIAGEWPHGRASLNDENYMRWVGEMHKTPGRGQ
jgi:hypothetical protein